MRSSLKKTLEQAKATGGKQTAKSPAIKNVGKSLTKKADPNPQKKIQSAGGNHTTGPPAKAPPPKSPSNTPKMAQQKNDKGPAENRSVGTGGRIPAKEKPPAPKLNKMPFQSQQAKQTKRDGGELGGAPPMKRFRNEEQTKESDSGQTTGDSHSHSKEGDQASAPPYSRQNRENDAFEDRKDGYTSSLFYGNPDIPNIPQTDVKPVSEKVFSEESFSTLDIAPQLVSKFLFLK